MVYLIDLPHEYTEYVYEAVNSVNDTITTIQYLEELRVEELDSRSIVMIAVQNCNCPIECEKLNKIAVFFKERHIHPLQCIVISDARKGGLTFMLPNDLGLCTILSPFGKGELTAFINRIRIEVARDGAPRPEIRRKWRFW